jgi:hypothetical protein
MVPTISGVAEVQLAAQSAPSGQVIAALPGVED